MGVLYSMPRTAPVGSDPTAWWRTEFLRAVSRYSPRVLTDLRDGVLCLFAEGAPLEELDRARASWRVRHHLHVLDAEDDWIEERARQTVKEWRRRVQGRRDQDWQERMRQSTRLMTRVEWRRWRRPQEREAFRRRIRAVDDALGLEASPTEQGRLGRRRDELCRGLVRLRQRGSWSPSFLRWWSPSHISERDAVTTDVRLWKEAAHLRWLAQWQCARWRYPAIAEVERTTSRETLRLLDATCEDRSLSPAERGARLRQLLLDRGEPWVSDRESGLWRGTWGLDEDGLLAFGQRVRALMQMRDGGTVDLAPGSVTRAIKETAGQVGMVRRVGRRGRPKRSTPSQP